MSEVTAWNVALPADYQDSTSRLFGFRGSAGSEDDLLFEPAKFLSRNSGGTFIASANFGGNYALELGDTSVTSSAYSLIAFGLAGTSPVGYNRRAFIGCRYDGGGSGYGGALAFATVDASNVAADRLFIGSSGLVRPGADNGQSLGAASHRWSVVYAASGSINTSDLREKTEIGDMPDFLLDAWANVRWVVYRFKTGQRIHAGQIAQWVHKELEKAGIDAFAYGLVGKDEWAEEKEPVTENIEVEDIEVVNEPTGKMATVEGEEVEMFRRVEVRKKRIEQRDTGKTRVRLKAGNRWNLRPDECAAVEFSWNRREHQRSAATMKALTDRVAALEGKK